MPVGHSVNANIAMVSAFSIHPDRDEAVRRGQEGFEFFGFALAALVARDSVPGRSRLWESFQNERNENRAATVTGVTDHAPRPDAVGAREVRARRKGLADVRGHRDR